MKISVIWNDFIKTQEDQNFVLALATPNKRVWLNECLGPRRKIMNISIIRFNRIYSSFRKTTLRFVSGFHLHQM